MPDHGKNSKLPKSYPLQEYHNKIIWLLKLHANNQYNLSQLSKGILKIIKEIKTNSTAIGVFRVKSLGGGRLKSILFNGENFLNRIVKMLYIFGELSSLNASLSTPMHSCSYHHGSKLF